MPSRHIRQARCDWIGALWIPARDSGEGSRRGGRLMDATLLGVLITAAVSLIGVLATLQAN
ncbi:hypothetical protein, partial [Actinophytocola sp.]|uniref:hypothetical protein n=1 Tax=Actinophytocola sp. TaxID=1872138 RepID=UPI002D7EBEFD